MPSLRLTTIRWGATKAIALLGLGCTVLTASAFAGSQRRVVTMDRFGHMASSISQDHDAESKQQFPAFAAPFTPGVQNTPHNSFATPGVQNTPQYKSFATPGTQNPSTSGWESSTAWNQPSNPWTSGGWSSTPQPQPYTPAPQYRPAPQPSPSWSWSGSTSTTTYRPTTPDSSFSSYTAPAPPVTYGGGSIRIRMPEWESRGCSYVLEDVSNAWNYTMRPGKSQTFPQDRAWTITFDRGLGHGTQSYRLAAGEYEFRQGGRGWELFRSRSSGADGLAFAPPPPQ